MKSIVLILSLTLISAAASAQTWATTKIKDSVTVQMPGTPVEQTRSGQVGSSVKLADSTEYSFTVINFEDFGLTEETLGQFLETDEFAEQYKTGITSQGGEVVSEKNGKVQDKYPYFEYELKTDKDGKSVTSHMRSVFYKAYGIILVYRPGQKGEDAVQMNKYFDSIRIGK